MSRLSSSGVKETAERPCNCDSIVFGFNRESKIVPPSELVWIYSIVGALTATFLWILPWKARLGATPPWICLVVFLTINKII